MAGMGKYLKSSGIASALAESGVFKGPGVAKESVMNGGDYVKAEDGMGIIAEAMTILQFQAFQGSEDYRNYKSSLAIETMEQNLDFAMDYLHDDRIGSGFIGAWEQSKESMEDLKESFESFQSSSESNENFRFGISICKICTPH